MKLRPTFSMRVGAGLALALAVVASGQLCAQEALYTPPNCLADFDQHDPPQVVIEKRNRSSACFAERDRQFRAERDARAEEQRQRQIAAQLQQGFVSSMMGVPSTALPDFCELVVDRSHGNAITVPKQELTGAQRQACTDAADTWRNGKQQRDSEYEAAYKKARRWVKVEADNGSVYKVDMGHVGRGMEGSAVAQIMQEHVDDFPQEVMFDCKGHYMMMGVGGPGMQYAPPRSVIGRISTIVCVVPKKPK